MLNTRLACLMTLFGVLLLAAMTSSAVTAVAADQPNVLLITADDLGIQLSCYGDPVASTPHMDELAASGVQFRTAYVAQASCSPSRSAMFTGMYPHGNGHYGLANANVGFQLHPHVVDWVLPNVLKRNGYRTGIIGKLHVNPEDKFAFDLNTREGFGERDVRKQIGFAREFLSASSDAPWFLMFNVFDPHVARKPLPDGSRGPQYLPDEVQGLPEKLLTADDVPPWPWQQIDAPEQLVKVAGYYNCVHRVDAAIGMLMGLLEESGFRDNTLIILLGDHGPPFTRGKTSVYEAGLRVPFLVRWPGVTEPHVSDRLVSSVDIVPTVLDAAGIEPPGELHGASLRPVLSANNNADWRDTLVAEFHYHGATPFFPRRAITDGRYKLIHNLRAGELNASNRVDGDQAYEYSQELPKNHLARLAMERIQNPPKWELYDLESDPIEFLNRAGDASLSAVEARLKQSLSTWQEATDDPFGDAEFRRKVEAKYKAAN